MAETLTGERNAPGSRRSEILVNVSPVPIIPHVSAQGARSGRPHVTTSKADGARLAASAPPAAKPFTFPRLGALSPYEYHLSILTRSMQTPVLFFSAAQAHFHSW